MKARRKIEPGFVLIGMHEDDLDDACAAELLRPVRHRRAIAFQDGACMQVLAFLTPAKATAALPDLAWPSTLVSVDDLHVIVDDASDITIGETPKKARERLAGVLPALDRQFRIHRIADTLNKLEGAGSAEDVCALMEDYDRLVTGHADLAEEYRVVLWEMPWAVDDERYFDRVEAVHEDGDAIVYDDGWRHAAASEFIDVEEDRS